MRQAVLFLTDKTSDYSLDAFDGLVKEAAGLADVFLVFHKKEEELPLDIRSRHPFVFSSSILHDLGYVPIGDSLLPGNNHYPLFSLIKSYLRIDCINAFLPFDIEEQTRIIIYKTLE